MPGTIAELINSIPVAEDGHIISRHHHNSIREALLAIAGQVGGGTGSGPNLLTFSPGLLPVFGETPWNLLPGIARNPTTGNPVGWLPLQLPDGSLIEQMIVTGGRTGTIETAGRLIIRLQRQFIHGDGSVINLINIDLKSSSSLTDPFQEGRPFAPAGLPAEQIEAARRVDNAQFIYLLRVELRDLKSDATAVLYSVQVELRH